MARPRTVWRDGSRRGISHYVKLAGVDVTYRWHDPASNSRKSATLRMVRKGKDTRYRPQEIGVMVDADETFTITQDKFVIDGSIRVPTTRDQVVDNGVNYSVVSFNQDNLEIAWFLQCRRESFDRASAGILIRE